MFARCKYLIVLQFGSILLSSVLAETGQSYYCHRPDHDGSEVNQDKLIYPLTPLLSSLGKLSLCSQWKIRDQSAVFAHGMAWQAVCALIPFIHLSPLVK